MDNKNITSEDMKFINVIFKMIAAACPAFKNAWPDKETTNTAKQIWIGVLKQEGLTSEQIHHGLGKIKSSFAPNVHKFVALCKPTPEELGLPPADIAYREAVRESHPTSDKNWSHEAIYQAAKDTGMAELRLMSQEQGIRRFKEHYERAIKSFMDGSLDTKLPKKLENREDQHIQTEIGKRQLAALKELLGPAKKRKLKLR